MHARSKEVVQTILGSSCARVNMANPEALADPNNERELFVVTWCMHPDLILDEKIMAMPKKEGSTMEDHRCFSGHMRSFTTRSRRFIIWSISGSSSSRTGTHRHRPS